MSTRIRSSSMGAIPRPKKHFTTRAGSVAVPTLDVRCACQFFQSESLLPERINPVGSRPSSSQGYHSGLISPDLTQPVPEPENGDPDSQEGFSFGLTDYYSGRPTSPLFSKAADTNISKITSQRNLPSSNVEHNGSSPGLQDQEILSEQKGTEVLRQKDPTESVLLRRRSESTQRNLDTAGQQRDPSTSSILRRRLSEKNITNIQQRDPSKSSMLRRRMDSQGSLQQQSSTEEPLAKEPKIKETTPVREPTRPSQPLTNAERFKLSKNTLQMKPSIELSDAERFKPSKNPVQMKPSIELSDLYRETMIFPESESKEQLKPKTIDMDLGKSSIQKSLANGNEDNVEKFEEDVGEAPVNIEDELNGSQDMLPRMANGKQSPYSPTSSALVHIGQNIYIEEPEQSSEQPSLPAKVERPSRRDYPDKKNKNTDDNHDTSIEIVRDGNKTKMVDEDHGSNENISGTLLPRDLREQSTVSTNSRTIKVDHPIPLKESKRDLSTSSILHRKYIRSQSFDSPTDVAVSTPVTIRQRDPSTSSLLRRRYYQGMEDTIPDKKPSAEEPLPSATELIENTTINLNSEVLESPSEIVPETTFKNISPIPTSTGRLREKMDWIERTYNTRDHEYEPIGESNDTAPIENASSQKDELPHESKTENQEDNSADAASITSHERKLLGVTNVVDEERDLQLQHIEEEVLAPTPQTDHSRNDEICTSQVDSSAIEDLPLRREDRKKSFMASTSDKTRNVQRKLSKQADRLKSKFKEMQKPKQEDSPKSERKRFRSPEFNKLKNIKMPKISKPELKRPEFTKFKKPDFKFTKPEILKKYDGFSSLRLRKKSTDPAESISDESKITRTTDDSTPTKKRFDFGTYPRIFDRMRRSGTGGTTISRDTEPDEECDRINTSGPILFSTVPRSKKDKNPIRSKWAGGPSYADDESSSGKFKHYSLDRESSIEKRMRLDFKDSIDADDEDGERGILQTEEQKQFADYDKENRAIHQISQAKEGEFRQRKPLIRQESDVVSEESNKELGWVDTDHLRNRLMAQSGDLDISQKEDYVNEGKDHQSTQETQSTGSSSNRRRKGVIEEIDDDEFFLRKKGISQDDIQIGKYISAAIREGLDTPVNALAQLSGGQYEPYYDEDFDISNERVDYGYDVPPRKPRRVRHFEKSLSSEFNDDSGMMPYNNDGDLDEDINVSPDSQFFQTYPPSRPRRKTRKQQSEESHDEHEVPVAAQYYPHPDEDDHSFYENKHMEGIEQPDIKVTYNEDDNLDIDYTPNEGQMPPKAPKRRKHLLRESVERDSLANNFVGRSVSNSYLTNENAEETVVFRTEHEYVPLVQPETFTTPTPTPRSRSKASPFTDDDRTSRGAESLAFDDAKLSTDLKDANGYAVVKKEPPPRPPAPLRRKRSTRSLGDRQFFTMPLRRNQNDLAPERPVRNYSTIGPTRPIRPARRVSLNSIEKLPSITSDATQYEEIDDINHLDKDHKADQNYTMKHRPLPPPPRPPRERKHRKSSESDGNKLDKDGGGEKITSKNVLGDISRISSEDMEEIEEMERSTQTDPLPDDYLCEEFDINSDMPIREPSFNRHSKTLEDILKEEQQAEMERARQIADENSLTKGIQKFREANQRSLSERSRGSTNDRPKTPSSRPITPSAVIIEKKTNLSTVETDAQLIVQPVDEDEIDATTNITHRNRFFAEDTVDTEDERIVNEALKRYNLLDSDFRDSSPQQDIELNIREVEPPSQTQSNEVPEIPLETPPQAPPRRKSSCAESTVAQISNVNDENVPIPEEDRTDIESHSGTMNLLPGNRLHINELEIEHLNVHDLQAGRILVSDLQAIAISSQDIECTSGDLTVKGITIPASFLEELINRARTTAIDAHPTEHEAPSQLTQESTVQQMPSVVPVTEPNPIPTNEPEQEPEPPARPPPPRSLYPSDYAQYSLPPPSFYQLRSYPDEIEEVLPHSPTTTHRQRRRFHRRRDSTSEEEEQREHRRSRQHNNRSPEPSIGDLSGQLMRACGSAIGRGGVKLYALMKEKKQEMKRRDISIGVAILIFVVAFLMMIGIRGERTVHHHHWDYWNPPGSSGRPT